VRSPGRSRAQESSRLLTPRRSGVAGTPGRTVIRVIRDGTSIFVVRQSQLVYK
jgi:hypothetical protein